MGTVKKNFFFNTYLYCLVGCLSMIVWTPAVLGVIYACVMYFCICTCSAQLSRFYMERPCRNIFIIIIIFILCVCVCRTALELEGLEDAVVLSQVDQDVLKDKHGCPAYVSPEILSATEAGYSGKSADVWSVGVMLYTMLVGRYPFHDSKPLALFGKIRRGHFHIPDSVSPKARCLIRCLLRREPAERLSAGDILSHPWFSSAPSLRHPPSSQHSKLQVVPDVALPPAPGPFDW